VLGGRRSVMKTSDKPTIKGRLMALLIGTLFIAFMGEGFARLILPVRNVGPILTEYDPELGKILKKSFRTTRWTPEFTMTFSTNSLGFRGAELRTPLPRETLILLFLGDSLTAGYGVNDGEEFPQLIAKRLDKRTGQPPVQVINAAVPGVGTGHALKFLKLHTNVWRQRTVLIYQFCGNDFKDNVREGLYSIDSRGKLIERGTRVPESLMRRLQPMVESIPGLSWSHLFAGILQTRSWLQRDPRHEASQQPSRKGELLTFSLVEELLSLAEHTKWPVIGLMPLVPDDKKSGIQALYDHFGVTTVAVPSKQERPDLYYSIDGHWNKEGHAYVAEALLPIIEVRIREFRDRLDQDRAEVAAWSE